ncbi:putative ABC transporter ATP-binding protein YxlF [bacterium BMS3Abin04]|nr:putative ABC transporter ATP-binding protein YxlF [bacterium BMS3Abin04]
MIYTLALENITKYFGRQLIFKNINFKFSQGNVYGLAGNNGSGKSTLTKIIAGVLSQNKGKVLHKIDNKEIEAEKLHSYLGFVSPYLMLYDEFTANENLFHFAKIRGIKFDEERIKYLLNEFNLYRRRNDLLKAYSSGMKQRMKFIFALQHSPKLLLLDEPTSNLDEEGKSKVYKIVENEKENSVVIIASNESKDLELCSKLIKVEEYK